MPQPTAPPCTTFSFHISFHTSHISGEIWCRKYIINGNVHPITGHEGSEGELIYTRSSSLSLTSALDGGGWSTPRLCRFTPGKTRYQLYWRLGGPQCRSGRVRKISPPTGIRSPDRPARSESLYRLHCPGPQKIHNTTDRLLVSLKLRVAQ